MSSTLPPAAGGTAAAPTYSPAPSVRLPAEAVYAGDVTQGTAGPRARWVQEWLTLGGVGVVIDGEFGAATAAAVRAFQRRAKLPSTGVVDRATFARLAAPMAAALAAPELPPGAALGDAVAAVARRHLAQHPREVGGRNSGPWVRLYMDGNQGAAWPWCAGFATFVLAQACAALGRPMPVGRTFSCDVLGERARAAGRLVEGRPADPAKGGAPPATGTTWGSWPPPAPTPSTPSRGTPTTPATATATRRAPGCAATTARTSYGSPDARRPAGRAARPAA